MGTSNSDFYRVVELSELERKDKADFKYIWFDLKVNGAENKLYLNRFREAFNIDPQDNVNNFRGMVNNWDMKKNRLRVICAASLPDEGYELFQNSQKIDRIILFCANKIKANKLIRDYPKIKRICYGYGEVIRVVRQWEREQLRRVIFFQDDSIQQLNIHTANWRSLTDSKSISHAQAHDHFTQYYKRMLKPTDRASFEAIDFQYRKCLVKNDHCIQFLKQFLLVQDKFMLNQVNSLLKSTTSPQKLSYLRGMVDNIYKAIKKFGSQTQDKSYYFQIALNEQQKAKLLNKKQSNILTFTHFIHGQQKSSYNCLSDYEIQVQIYINNKKKEECQGYVIFSHQILMNLGNYYKIQAYNSEQRKLKLSLLYLSDIDQKNVKQKLDYVNLNVKWGQFQQQKYEGQWNSLKQRNKTALIESYLGEKVKEIKKQPSQSVLVNQMRIKLQVSKLKYNNSKEDQQIINNIERLYEKNNYSDEKYHLLQIYFKTQKNDKFLSYFQKIPKINLSIASTNVIAIYNFLYLVLKNKKEDFILSQMDQFQARLITEKNIMVEDIYHIFLEIKIECLNILCKYTEQIEVIKQFLLILLRCSGKNSYEYWRISTKLVQVINKQNNKLYTEEIALKNKLSTSKCSVESLRESYNEPFVVDISSLNANLFEDIV